MDAPTRLWVLQQLETLCTSLAPTKERFQTLYAQWEAVMALAMGLTAQMEHEDEASFLSILLSDGGRMQLGDTLAAYMAIEPKRFQVRLPLTTGAPCRLYCGGFASCVRPFVSNEPPGMLLLLSRRIARCGRAIFSADSARCSWRSCSTTPTTGFALAWRRRFVG
jgi:hypothetical protein